MNVILHLPVKLGTVPIFVSTKMGLSPFPQMLLDTNRLTQDFLQGLKLPILKGK